MKGLPAGERRRVSIARELVMRPHIVFIDEPLYHLDRLVSHSSALLCQLYDFSISLEISLMQTHLKLYEKSWWFGWEG